MVVCYNDIEEGVGFSYNKHAIQGQLAKSACDRSLRSMVLSVDLEAVKP